MMVTTFMVLVSAAWEIFNQLARESCPWPHSCSARCLLLPAFSTIVMYIYAADIDFFWAPRERLDLAINWGGWERKNWWVKFLCKK